MINQLNIKNFKSIKELNFSPKRINIFIGAPNVGKSNILEALSLFSVPYVTNDENKFKDLIRFNNLKNLFYDNITQEKAEVKTNIGTAQLIYQDKFEKFDLLLSQFPLKYDYFEHNNTDNVIKNRLNFNKYGKNNHPNSLENKEYYSSVRKYTYNKNTIGNESFHLYLLPPDGRNLITIIQKSTEIFDETASFFETYGLELLYDIETNNFEIQKKQGKRDYKYPFKLIADTLRRIIFYLTVTETNKETTILLEEPETHSFPPYTKMLAERIAVNETNQFFITTHSPYLLHNIIENSSYIDRNIIITYYEDYQTKIKILNEKEIKEIIEDDIEIFFNSDKFIGNE